MKIAQFRCKDGRNNGFFEKLIFVSFPGGFAGFLCGVLNKNMFFLLPVDLQL